MFFGTNPSIVSQYIRQRLEEIKPTTVFAPFAGNFVIEQLVADYSKEVHIHSTDVALYSRAIGFGATGQEFDATLKPEIAELFPEIATKTDPMGKAAQIIFFGDVAKLLSKANIPYYRSMIDDAQRNQMAYFDKIMGKLERFKEKIGHMNFYGNDACELMEAVGKGDVVFYDPPVATGSYEKEYKALESCYTFTPPPYKEMTPELKMQQLEDLDKLGAIVFWRTNNPLPAEEVPAGYKQVYQAGYKYNAAYCLYTNKHDIKRFVARFNPLEEQVKHYPLIGYDDIITEDSVVEVIGVPTAVGDHFRLMWVKKAEMLDSGSCYLVFVDKKMVGLFALSSGLKFSSSIMQIVSDPACPCSRYRRLSKLIIGIICTRPMLNRFNDESLWAHDGWTTRVFTNGESSMKYRSLFKLAEKALETEGNYKYKLIYRNRDKIFETYKDVLVWFLKNDGKVLNKR